MQLTNRMKRLAQTALTLLMIGAGSDAVAAAAADQVYALDEADRNVYGQLLQGQRIDAGRSYVNPDVPTVYLTFDDGPSKWTSQVLDILREEGVSATFFMLGSQAEAHPDLVKKVAQEGHAVGNHSYNHRYEELYPEFEAFRDQADRTSAIIEGILGEAPRLLRAPGGTFGHFTPFYFYLMEQAGYSIFDWNVDSGDALRKDAKAADIVRGATPAKPPRIAHVLMHDGGNREQTVKALPDIIRYYKERGYAFAHLDPNVEPVQFRYSPGKAAGKPMTEARFATLLAEARSAAAARGPTGQNGQAEQNEQTAQSKELRLTVEGGASTEDPSASIVLDESRYRLKAGRFWVPLPELAALYGAELRQTEDGTAWTAMAGKRLIVVRPKQAEVELVGPLGYGSRHTPAELTLTDGEPWAPLRAAVEWFGSGVAAYELQPERLVTLSAATAAYWPATWRLLPTWRKGPTANGPGGAATGTGQTAGNPLGSVDSGSANGDNGGAGVVGVVQGGSAKDVHGTDGAATGGAIRSKLDWWPAVVVLTTATAVCLLARPRQASVDLRQTGIAPGQ